MRMGILLIAILFSAASGFAANGDLTVHGTINAGSGGIIFPYGANQKAAAIQVLSADTREPGTNDYTITIPPTTSKINLSYEIIPSVDAEPVMIGFNDNVSATGAYSLYPLAGNPSISGKIHSGYGRTSSGSSGQFNSFDIIASGNMVLVNGDHISEGNVTYWAPSFKGYLKYNSPQTITKINLKCLNPGTTISKITWKVVALP